MLRILIMIAAIALFIHQPVVAQDAGDALPDYRLDTLIGSRGEAALSDFIGRPVLLVRWTPDETGRAAIEWAAAMDKAYRKTDLAVILLPTQPWLSKSGAEEIAALALVAPDHEMMLSAPVAWRFPKELSDPAFLLVGSDGKFLLADTIESRDSRFKKAMKSDQSLRKKGWGETSIQRHARTLALVEGRLAAGWNSLGSTENEEVREEIKAAVQSRRGKIERLIAAGEFLHAELRLEAFRKDVGQVTYYRELGDDLAAKLAASAAQSGQREAKSLKAMTESIRRGRASEKDVERLGALIEQATNELVLNRARLWQEVAEAEIRLSASDADYFTISQNK